MNGEGGYVVSVIVHQDPFLIEAMLVDAAKAFEAALSETVRICLEKNTPNHFVLTNENVMRKKPRFSNEKRDNYHVSVMNGLFFAEKALNCTKAMKRNIDRQLREWKQSDRRKPLIVNGVRHVGKSHALKYFGETSYQNIAYLNFEKDEKLAQYFRGDPRPKATHKNFKRPHRCRN